MGDVVNLKPGLEETKESLRKMQEFDPEQLSRVQDLGKWNFVDAVKPAKELVDLHRRLPLYVLDDFVEEQLNDVKGLADRDYDLFRQILNFDPEAPINSRESLIQQVRDARDSTFRSFFLYIAYSACRVMDSANVEERKDAILNTLIEHVSAARSKFDEMQTAGEQTLEALRKTSAEHGVSQNASYFKDEAEMHQKSAQNWQWATISVAASLVVWALFSPLAFEWLYPDVAAGKVDDNEILLIQVTTSKILVFVALGYLLALCGKTYLSHNHNAVINKHRQNALLTYNTLVKAAADNTNADIVLNHAAGCIFSPQDSGYVKGDAKSPALSIVGAAQKIAKKEDE